MNIIISTVQRPNKTPYLDWCIDSIRKEYKGIIHLIVGGEDVSYVAKYNEGFVKHFIAEFEKPYSTNRQKAGLGYYTALTLDPTESALIFEDDGILEEGWSTKLKMLKTYIPFEKYILSLISPSKDSVPQPESTVPSVQHFSYKARLDYGKPGELPVSTIITYSNTTGMYYPVPMLQSRLAEFVHKYAVEENAYYDIVVGQYMFRYQIPIYITVPNLLKNVDTPDSSLGANKEMTHIDYTGWDFTK